MNKGPCIGCGRKNYPMSMGGPTLCPECDMGIDPKFAALRREHQTLNNKLLDALFALQIATGHKAEYLTDIMRKRGERYLVHFKEQCNQHTCEYH